MADKKIGEFTTLDALNDDDLILVSSDDVTYNAKVSLLKTTANVGADGKSAYEIAVENGYTGTETEWLSSLKGEKGDTGETGPQGEKGEKGDTGATGAQGEAGAKGDKGDAFTYSDFTAEQLAALKGEKGDTGAQGEKGDPGTTDYKALTNLPRTPLTVTAETDLRELAEGAYDVYTENDETVTLDTCIIDLKTGDTIIYRGGIMTIAERYSIPDTSYDYKNWNLYYTASTEEIYEGVNESLSGGVLSTKLGSRNSIEHDASYRLGTQTKVTVSKIWGYNYATGQTTTTIPYTFRSEVIFKSGETATTFSYKSGWVFSGDDCTDGVFVPQANKTYVVKFRNISATDGEEEIVGRVEAYSSASTTTSTT